jgi:beta-lactamase regulating signal transducer with metallopeptidase domain
MSAMNSIGAAERYSPVEYRTDTLRQIFTTGAVIWAIIAVAALITAAILYSLTRKELRNAIRIRNNIYRSDMLLSPILTGLIKQRIILPESLDPDSEEGGMVLAHENTHRRRFDNIWRLLGVCITCLHWFNPLVWIMLKAFFNDMELSCDENVIRKMSEEKRKVYAGALLRFAEDQRLLVSTAFGQSGVKIRVVNVLNYKRLTIIGIIVSSLFLLVIIVSLITNPHIRLS